MSPRKKSKEQSPCFKIQRQEAYMLLRLPSTLELDTVMKYTNVLRSWKIPL